MRRGVLLHILAALVVGWLVWQFKPDPEPTFRVVRIRHDVLVKGRPDTVEKIVHRIAWRTLEPRLVARSLEPAELDRVRLYCAPSNVLERPDTVPPPPSLLPSFAGKYDGNKLELWSTLSDGRSFYQATKARTPLEWVAVDSTVTVREQRGPLRFLKKLPKFILPVAVGFVAGRVF